MRNNDRVVIKMGPARYDSDKAVRDKITDAVDEATNDAYNSIVNNPNLDLAGGGGAAAPTVDPFGIPRAYLSTDFPLETRQTIPFDITAGNNTGGINNVDSTTTNGDTFVFDLPGNLGVGADTILGPNAGRGSITGVNAFTRSTGVNVNLYASASTRTHEFYMQQGTGRVFTSDSTNTPSTTLYHRAVSDTTWTTVSLTTPLGYAFDPQTGWFWYMRDPSGNANLSYISPSTTSFAAESNYGLTTVGNWLDNSLIAGHGFLAVLNSPAGTGTFYRKASNSTANFSAVTTYTAANFSPGTNYIRRVQISPSGNLSYLYPDGTTGTWHVRELLSTGAITDADLGLDTSIVNYANHMFLANGKMIIMISADDSFFGFADGYQMLGVIVYDGVTSTVVYYDATNVSDPAAQPTGIRISRPVEVIANKIRFGAYSDLSTGAGDDYAYIYELTIT